MKENIELLIYIDGASRGNPGDSAVGIVVKDKDQKIIKEISKSIGRATNNIAEYYALIFALQEALKLKAQVLTVFTDSQLLYSQVKGEYRVKDEKLTECPKCGGQLKKLLSTGSCSVSYSDSKEHYQKEIEPEVKRIAEKIKNGDENTAADIFGES